jgi:hypothetical protein
MIIMAKLTYPVLSTLTHDEETYAPGKTITLEEAVGEPLVANGTLGEGKAAKAEKAEKPTGGQQTT